ncbi:hypothetical protein BH20ACT16_BH20ACT16_01700 [soil metagenome]
MVRSLHCTDTRSHTVQTDAAGYRQAMKLVPRCAPPLGADRLSSA